MSRVLHLDQPPAMSVYLPKLDSYPLYEPELLVRDDSSRRTKRSARPVHNGYSSLTPLPDIRITNGLTQRARQPPTSPALSQEDSVNHYPSARDVQERTVMVSFRTDDNGDIVGDSETPTDDADTHSPRTGRSPGDSLKGHGFSKDGAGNSKDKWKAGARRRLWRSDSRPSIHILATNPPRLRDKAEVRRKFAQAINAVMSIRKLASAMVKKSEEPSAMLKTFTDIIDMDNFSENLKNQGLSFDPSYFKANKEISISSEVKNILRLPPSSRSQEQIQTAMYGLQSLPSFAEYPLHMQEKLTKVAWYQVVPPKRTIIRQGHYAENFYFILSGQAVVTILIRDPKTGESHVRTANFMRKGTSFGELALLHHSRRTATVTSHDTVQLLSIGRDDFFDIFMARQGQDEIPEHIKFISQLDFMKGWPIERLLERPEHCLLHFFKRNMVIVKDSEQSEWLYIVKSGSCQVLKQLRGVTARLGIPKHEVTLDESFHLPHTGTAVRGPKVDTGMWRPRPRSHRSVPEPLEELTEERAPPPSERRNRLVGPRRQRPSTLTPESTPRSDTSRPPAPPVFVQVSRLKPRDVFGLEMVKFHADLDALHTSVSLVSRGAECIMLSKDFFRKHATDTVKKNLQEIVRPYPDEVTFQESLQRKADWELFKHTLIEDLTSPPVV